jgi:hypothetical protein
MVVDPVECSGNLLVMSRSVWFTWASCGWHTDVCIFPHAAVWDTVSTREWGASQPLYDECIQRNDPQVEALALKRLKVRDGVLEIADNAVFWLSRLGLSDPRLGKQFSASVILTVILTCELNGYIRGRVQHSCSD